MLRGVFPERQHQQQQYRRLLSTWPATIELEHSIADLRIIMGKRPRPPRIQGD
jgi:hypothetical protein